MRLATKCRFERIKLKKSFDPLEEPYAVMARISEVIYKLTQQSTPRKLKFLKCINCCYVQRAGENQKKLPLEATNSTFVAQFF